MKHLSQYGLKRKQEIWRMDSLLKKFLNRAKTIIRQKTSQAGIEKKQLLTRLHSMGLLKKDSSIEEVLNLTLKDVMERRLQTLLCRKNIAKSMLEARQLITHQNILIGGKKVTSPAYMVLTQEEPSIQLLSLKKAE
jgi:small subunit ribosomal protein S4